MTEKTDLATRLRQPRLLGLLIIVLLVFEKFLAHTYTVITIYVLPEPWKFWVPGIIGGIGFLMIIRGLGRDEVKGTILGYTGAVLIWMSWFESGLPIIARYNEIQTFLPSEGNLMAGLLGEHVILQASGLFMFLALFFVMLNKDVRCRMMLWIRRRIGLGTAVGVPAPGNRPNVSRVAAFEYFFVTWFMYVITLIIVDPRLFGLYHTVTYTLCTLIALWGIYLMFLLTKQREVGFALRYGIGAVGVAWFIPEVLALYEKFYEFYLWANKYPITMTSIFVIYIGILVFLWRTPVDPETGRATDSLELFEQAAHAGDCVVDADGTQCVPDARNIDRYQRLLQPVLQRREHVDRGKVGAALNDGVDVVAVDLANGIHDHVDGCFSNGCGRWPRKTLDRCYFEADVTKKAAYIVIADWRIGRNHGDLFRVEILERVAGGARTCGQAQVANLAPGCPVRTRLLPSRPPQNVSADMPSIR